MVKIQHQNGMTLLGFIIVAGVVSFFALIAMKVFPLYNESFAVTHSLESVVNQPDASEMTTRELQRAFLRYAQINSLYRFNDSNIGDYMTVNRGSRTEPRTITFAYEGRRDLFGELVIALVYERTVELGAN
jgi:Tfp pilus assembly major pilin PilA